MAAKRYELTEAQGARIAPLLPGKIGDPGRRLRIIVCSSRDACGFCGQARTGAICRSGTAGGKRCISASAAGAMLVSGSACSLL
jgi:hypothetical protein